MPDSAWDVFISYAHADDEVPVGAAKGWVTTLAGELRKVLRRKLGGDGPRLFMDHQLAANEGLTPSLQAALRGSRALVLVMSPGYQKSRWCQWELARFFEAEGAGRKPDSVFVVETLPTDSAGRASWRSELQDLIPLRFWEQDEIEDKAARTLGYPVPKADEDSRYWRNVNELAHLIAQRLAKAEGPAEAPRPAVWIGETTEDLLEERESVAAALSQQGYEVIPAAPYPRDGEAPYREALRRDLERAVMLIQLFGPREGHRPAWGGASFVALQAAAAAAAAQARGVEICQWRARETDPAAVTNDSYRELLLGPRVVAGRIEELKQEVLQRLARARTAAADAATGAARPNLTAPAASASPAPESLHVYVNADSVDRDLALQVQDSLSDLGVSSALAPSPSPAITPEQIRLAQQEQIEASDAVVLVYGLAPVTWVHSQFAFTRRTLAQQRRQLRTALVDGPPFDKQEAGLRGPGILALSCRSGFEADVLGTFVEVLRSEAANG